MQHAKQAGLGQRRARQQLDDTARARSASAEAKHLCALLLLLIFALQSCSRHEHTLPCTFIFCSATEPFTNPTTTACLWRASSSKMTPIGRGSTI